MKRFKFTTFKIHLLLITLTALNYSAKAQFINRDIVFDYGTPGGCLICGSGYECISSGIPKLNTFTDTTSGLRLIGLKVFVYYTACSGSPTDILLNGKNIGTISRSSTCACNDCYVDSITVSPSNLSAFRINGKDTLILVAGGTQCIDRVVIRKVLGASAPLDAALASIDSPFYACPGVPENIKVTIANYGTTRIDSVEVHWTYNGSTQSMYKHTSTIDTIGGAGSYLAQVTLGTKTLPSGKYDTMVVWTKNPNGTADTVTSNDTMVAYLKGALSDTFTVGGTSPDYSTLQDAINDLMANGLCGPVVLNMRNGTYNEQVTVGSIVGSSSTNTLTIRSESGDSSAVVINYSSTSSAANYVIRLTKTSNVIFSRVSIEALSSSYGRGLYLTGSNSIQLKNCRLMGTYSFSTSSDLASLYVDYTAGVPTHNISVLNCQFDGNAYGIYNNGGGANRNNVFVVTNSVFQDQYYMNCYLNFVDNIAISGSRFERNTSSYQYGYGLYLVSSGIQGLNINRNKILERNGGVGLYMSSCVATDSTRGKVYNNFISSSINSGFTCQAIYIQSSTYMDVVFNSLYVKSTTSSTKGAYFNSGGNIRLLNNAIFNEGVGPAIYHDGGGNTFSRSDRNNLFTNGTPFAYYNSASIASFGAWKSTTQLDSHSFSSNPNYTSPTDLHAYSVDLNARAETYSGITTDIDGQTRNSTIPDIGADEFDLAPDDAGLAEFRQLVPGTSCVNVVLKNFGNDTLKTVSILWQIDGVSKTTYSWSGNLGAGDTDIVCLGTHFIKYDSFYNIKAWTSQPNSKTDTINYNDTLEELMYPALSGVYTIGGTAPDFATFGDAIDAMINGGIIDSVRFRVRAGTYTEQLILPEIRGVRGKNAITFESENMDSSSVILQYSGSNVIYLNGADGVTIRHMTIRQTSSSYVVYIDNGANENMLYHNKLENTTTTSTSSYYSVVYSDYSTNNDNSYVGNLMLNGSYGIYFSGNDDNPLVKDNLFSNQYYMGLYIEDCMDAIIAGNRIESNSILDGYYGMYIFYLYGRNYIFDNKFNGPAQKEYAGVYIYGLSTNTGDSSWIYNNFITVGRNISGTSYAFYVDNVYRTLIANNSIHCYSVDSLNSFALYTDDGDGVRLLNNNLVHSGGGYPYYNDNTSTVDQSDYNNFYWTGSRVIYYNSNYTTLAAYQMARSRDTFSINVDPIFNSQTDLHVSNVLLDSAALSLSEVVYDIDGQPRNPVKPDIGADEFAPPQNDLGVTAFISPGSIFPADTLEIEVLVYNFGLDTVTVYDVYAVINSDTFKILNHVDTIVPGGSGTVKLDSFSFNASTLYSLTAWTAEPNNTTDEKLSNDTFKILNRNTALSGVYTIGGTTPDFANFTTAVNALKTRGIIDSVRFRVRAGTYTEQIRIPAITGAGAKNSIIFESETMDSSSVILTYASTFYDTNYTVFLNGADGITFRNLTLRATNASYSHVVLIENAANFNCFLNNRLVGASVSTTSDYNAIIFSELYGQVDEFNEFRNNHFVNGSTGMAWFGNGSYPNYYEYGNVIDANLFDQQYYQGLYFYYQWDVKITNNVIRSTSAYTSYYGILGEQNYGRSVITGNDVQRSSNGDYGIYLYYLQGSSADTVLVANNIINIGGIYSSLGLYLYNASYVHVINNTIRNASTNTGSYAFYASSGSNNWFYNNIMVNDGPGYASYVGSSTNITRSDNNNFKTGGSNFVYWNGTNYATLTALQAASLKDSNSLSVNPLFFSSTNLHVKELSLNRAARPYYRVLADFDGQQRDSLNPDIGADEFIPPPLDAGISDVIIPKIPFPSDSQFVKVVLKNYGMDTLKNVQIKWQLNGITQTTYNWSGNLKTADTIHVRLEKKFFNKDSSYKFKVWTSLPNGTADTINSNDTFFLQNQYTCLSGSYTIGGASPDYPTFNDAVNAMKRGGICGQVIFNVRNGTYQEQVRIPKILGADTINSIIFQSESMDSTKVNLFSNANTSAAYYTVRLDSAVGITFRYLTITTASPTYGRVFEILNGSKYIRLTNNIIDGYATSSTGDNLACIYSYANSSNNHYNEYLNNKINNGSFGIYLYGYSSGVYDNKTIIRGNVMESPYYMGIYVQYTDSIKIERNQITMDAYTWSYGLYMNNCVKGFRVYGNYINQPSYYYGVYMYNCDGTSTNRGLFANNMVYVGSDGSVIGVYFDVIDYADIYHNNINIVAANTGTYAAYFSGGSNLRVVNNVFRHGGTGYAYYTGSTGNITQSDYNSYYSGGTNLAYWGGNRTTLAALKSANAKDASSISIDPDYVSNTDLHVRETDLNEAALKITSITEDFDGEVRDSIKPDIGADEFKIPAKDDAGISAYVGPVAPFAAGSQNVVVKIKNFGSDSLKSATINWNMNGTSQSPFSWTGGLKTGQEATVTIGTYSFTAGIQYILDAWTTSPNGQSDTINYNDTMHKNKIYSALDGNYTIGGTLPDFNTFATAVEALHIGGVIDTVNFLVRNGTYTEQVLINAYPGSAPYRPVTFTSQSGDSSKVILQYNSDYSNNYIFQLNGADYVTVSRMTLQQLSNYYGYLFVVNNVSVGATLSNCAIKGYNNYYYYYYYSAGVYSSADKDDSLTIRNNQFSNLYYGILIYGGGSSVSNYESGLRITDNAMSNIFGYGVYLYYFKAPVISGNIINSYASSGSYLIYTGNTSDKLEISYNKLYAAYNYASGIYVVNHVGSSTLKGAMFNNFIALNSAGGTYGIYSYNNSYLNFYFNSVNMYGSSTSSRALYIDGGNNLDMRNNILSNPGGGYSIFHNAASVSQSDYNDLYTSGTNLGYYGGANRTNLAAWKSATSKDANSKSVDPIFNSNTDLHTNLINLDSAATPISGITDDIDRDTRNTTKPDIGADEFNSLPNNLSIVSIISPLTGCTLDSQILTVRVYNYGSNGQKDFPVKYNVNGGTVVSETFTDSLAPGANANYSFATKIDMSAYGTYNIVSWCDLSTEQFRYNDTVKGGVINYQQPVVVSSMIPADSTKNLNFPISLSWSPSMGATMYDVFIWPDSVSTRPSSPAYTNITQISQQISSGLGYGFTYKWQIVAKNTSCSTDGPVQVFTVRELPDFIVTNVNVPSTAFSGKSVSVSWSVKNNGTGPVSGSWWDIVYLSTDLIYNAGDVYMGGVSNPSALNPGQSYNQSISVNLPNGISGTYHFVVRSDAYNYQIESNEANNDKSDTTGMVVSLTPPPDLQVISVTKPGTVFSGQTIPVNFTVKNKGTGNTLSSTWYDLVYISQDSIFSGAAVNKSTHYHSGALDPDSSYIVNTTMNIPLTYVGKYFIYVTTDAYNYVYEHATESNNTGRSDSLKVILTPPPDLVVRNASVVDTASNRESITLQYHNINIGSSETVNSWYDDIYISTNTTFSTSTATLLGNVFHDYLDAGDTDYVSKVVTIPAGINGNYQLFVVTDYINQVFEGVNDTNNIFGPKPIFVRSPDLVVPLVQTPVSDTSGKTIQVNWWVKNQGPGNSFGGSRIDRIFISGYKQYHKDSVIQIDSVDYSATILAGDSAFKTKMVALPHGYYGDKYVYVTTDALNGIFENGNESNNTGRSDTIHVILEMYPDLRSVSVSGPDSSEAGQAITVNFKVDNIGNKIAQPVWKDRIFVSKDSVYNPAKVLLLGTQNYNKGLEVNEYYNGSMLVTLPATMSAGNYYFYLFTEATDVLYEYLYESNNIIRSSKVYINGYPPIDLDIQSITAPDSVKSGQNINFSWSVKNIGEAMTFADFWTDRAYFSTDTIFDSGDKLIGESQVDQDVKPDSTYTVNQSFAIPNGMSGDYYVLVLADAANVNNDEDTTNNKDVRRNSFGVKMRTNISLTPPPDLQITSWAIPSTGTSGQPIKVVWTVKNKGTGPTVTSSWADYIYLSTDYVINYGDYLIGTRTHNGNLAVNGIYSDSGDFFIPAYLTGNYIVIVRTDEGNVVYEHTNEGNNTVASAITIGPAPPADLIVSSVSAPASIIAGRSVTVNYQIKNIGSNPVLGYETDNIYASKDSIWDGTDFLFESANYYTSLAPNGTANRSMTNDLKGVSLGDYYFIVVTDVLNNVSEVKDTNNSKYSDPVFVTVPLLPMNTLTPDTLFDNKDLYYRLEIPGNLDGESILVQLKGDSIKGNNELFLKFGAVPTRSNFDFGYSTPFYGNQEIIIPDADSGVYYLLAYGNSSIADFQKITLFARILEFEIRKVSPVSGGNTGQVTLRIEGAKFDSLTEFSLVIDSLISGSFAADTLVDLSLIYDSDERSPTTRRIVDPTTAYITFDLKNIPTGVYDVIGDKGQNETAVLNKGFTVKAGLPPEIQISVYHPGSTRTGSVISFQVLYNNSGNTDAVNATLVITSNGGSPIALTPEGLNAKTSSIEVRMEDLNGLPGVLRPGSNGTVTIYTQATTALGFSILLPKND
jgi:parallel beta-helix repeat protein